MPAPLGAALADLLKWFKANRTNGVIIGGIAVSLIADPRTTRDIDAMVWLDTDVLEHFLLIGKQCGFLPRRPDAVKFARRNRVLLMQHAVTKVDIDISCGVLPFEAEILQRVTRLRIGKLVVPVPSPEDLVIMKAVAHRPQDLADIDMLVELYPTLDKARIRSWVAQFAEALENPKILEDLNRLIAHRRLKR